MTLAQARTLAWMQRSRHNAKLVHGAVLVNLGPGGPFTHALVETDGSYRTVALGTEHEAPKLEKAS